MQYYTVSRVESNRSTPYSGFVSSNQTSFSQFQSENKMHKGRVVDECCYVYVHVYKRETCGHALSLCVFERLLELGIRVEG